MGQAGSVEGMPNMADIERITSCTSSSCPPALCIKEYVERVLLVMKTESEQRSRTRVVVVVAVCAGVHC
jgi:hypothetical protein